MSNQAIQCCNFDAPRTSAEGILGFQAQKRTFHCVIWWVKLAWMTVHERHALSKLDEDQLRDIGVNRHQARQESERAPWDLPVERLED